MFSFVNVLPLIFDIFAIKSSNVDIGRVSRSTAGRVWSTGFDIKLDNTMLSMTY